MNYQKEEDQKQVTFYQMLAFHIIMFSRATLLTLSNLLYNSTQHIFVPIYFTKIIMLKTLKPNLEKQPIYLIVQTVKFNKITCMGTLVQSQKYLKEQVQRQVFFMVTVFQRQYEKSFELVVEHLFSSPELKTQVKFSDRLSSVCLSTVHMFIFFSRTITPFSTKLGTKHPWALPSSKG